MLRSMVEFPHPTLYLRIPLIVLALLLGCGSGEAADAPPAEVDTRGVFTPPCQYSSLEGTSIDFDYDASGRLARARMTSYEREDVYVTELEYTRDHAGRIAGAKVVPIQQEDTEFAAGTRSVVFSPFCRQMPWAPHCFWDYDNSSFVSCTDEDGHDVCEFDAQGRLLRANDDEYDGQLEEYQYDAQGRILSVTVGSRLRYRYEYDGEGRLVRLLSRTDGEDYTTFIYTGVDNCLSQVHSGIEPRGPSDSLSATEGQYICTCSPNPTPSATD